MRTKPWSEEKVQKRLAALRSKVKRDARKRGRTILTAFEDKSLEDLVSEHLRLRHTLGSKHPMVSKLWSEILRRREAATTV